MQAAIIDQLGLQLQLKPRLLDGGEHLGSTRWKQTCTTAVGVGLTIILARGFSGKRRDMLEEYEGTWDLASQLSAS